MKKLTFLLSILIMLSACSVNQSQSLSTNVEVIVTEPDRIRFAGKGAGAGMMLMSSMGPTGIAIGIAIDEGIGKTIADTAIANNIDFVELVKADFSQKLASYNQQQQPVEQAKLEIQRYGFLTKGGENDPTTSEYIIRYQLGNGDWQEFHFPNHAEQASSLLTQPLEQVKTDQQAILLLIQDGLSYLQLE